MELNLAIGMIVLLTITLIMLGNALHKSNMKIQRFKDNLEKLKNCKAIQCTTGNWDCNPYMHGYANGFILAESIINDSDPKFLDRPECYLEEAREHLGPFVRDAINSFQVFVEMPTQRLESVKPCTLIDAIELLIDGIDDSESKEVHGSLFNYDGSDAVRLKLKEKTILIITLKGGE